MKRRACKPPALERDAGPTAACRSELARDPVQVELFKRPDDFRVVSRASSLPQASSLQQDRTHDIFVQVGAFGERANAERRLGALSVAGIEKAFIHEEQANGHTLYRVRIGPVADVVQYDVLVEELERIGITDPYLIAE
jgi:cell division protein FtsN